MKNGLTFIRTTRSVEVEIEKINNFYDLYCIPTLLHTIERLSLLLLTRNNHDLVISLCCYKSMLLILIPLEL